MTWTDPKTWAAGLLKEKDANTHLSDNMEFLYSRNKSVITERGVANSTAAQPMGSTVITTNGGDLMFRVSAMFSTASAAAGDFDIVITLGGGGGTVYASSRTSTALTGGVYTAFFVPNAMIPINFCVVVPNIPAGTHTVALTMAGTGATLIKNSYPSQFIVEEYGVQGSDGLYNAGFDWANGAIVTAGRLNNNVRDNLNYLFNRNYITKNWSTLYQTTATTFVSINGEKVALKTDGRDIQVSLLIPLMTLNVTASIVYIDVLVDNDYYISSLTDTPLTDGWINARGVAGRTCSFYVEHILKNLEAGWHTFELYYKSSTASSNARIVDTTTTQLMLEEIGLRS